MMQDLSQLMVIGPRAGLSPGISDLVSMMNYARFTTLHSVAGLTTAQLDHVHDAESNSIGALLLHIAAVEFFYTLKTFRGAASEEELRPWTAALDLGEAGRSEIRGHNLDYYTDLLESGRNRTQGELAQRDDAWLRTVVPFGEATANYYFMWFHVFEDEVNHRGQIRWLRKRLPQEM